jgi:hypothetical protein
MSGKNVQALTVFRAMFLWGLIGCSGLVVAADAEAPDLEFLEYLGSWEADEEDWVLLAPDATPDEASNEADKESVETPDGDQLAELNDES